MYDTIKYEVDGHKATITLNRPDALNALSPHMITELRAAYAAAENDDNLQGADPGREVDQSFRPVLFQRVVQCVRTGPQCQVQSHLAVLDQHVVVTDPSIGDGRAAIR